MSLYLVERVLPGITMQQFGAFAAYNNFREVLHSRVMSWNPTCPRKERLPISHFPRIS